MGNCCGRTALLTLPGLPPVPPPPLGLTLSKREKSRRDQSGNDSVAEEEQPIRLPDAMDAVQNLHTRLPPDNLHPTLSSWLDNMKKLKILINRLHELASSAPAEHQSQLLNQVAALRETSKRQQERLDKFLQLSEEYASKYLHDISAEIQQQSTVLDNLQERLEAAKKLHGKVAGLQTFYESGTVAAMKDFRATAISRPLPKDSALFDEVDFVMAEIRRFYEELNKFWTVEIGHVVEALQKRRIEQKDIGRWSHFHLSLKQTIEAWKNPPKSAAFGDPRTLRCNNARSSNKPDIGAVAKSMSSVMSLLTSVLDRVTLSDSVNYLRSGRSFIQRVYVAFEANKDMCFSFLRRCVDYGEKMFTWCSPSISLPTSPRVGAPHDLRERTMRLWSERTSVSAKNAASVQGPRKFKATFNKALSLEQKKTSELNVLLEILFSWFTVTNGHGPPGDPDVITLEQLREQWVKTKDFLSAAAAALVILENGQAPELFDRSAPLASTRRRLGSVIKRWMLSLGRF